MSSYKDAGDIHDYAKDAISWANAEGYITGVSDDTLSPRENATREQFAAILERYDKSKKDTVLEYNEPVLISTYTAPEKELVTDADFYVSVGGDDGNDGTFEHPFATFERARDAVRGLIKTKTEGDIKVAFKAGEYGPLSIDLTEEDSGNENRQIIWCAYGDGEVSFDNGIVIKESEFKKLDAEDEKYFDPRQTEYIKKADFSKGISSFDPKGTLVFSNDGVCNLSRYPNILDDGTDQLIRFAYTADENHIALKTKIYKNIKNRVDSYHSVKGLYFYGYISTGWYKDMIATDGYTIDEETGNYVFYIPHPEESRGGHLRLEEWFPIDYYQMCIVNVSEETDSKCEYWIDTDTETLYMYDPHGDVCFTGGTEEMISMDGTRFVTFKGLSFRNSQEIMIDSVKTRGIVIDDCEFTGCGSDRMVNIQQSSTTEPFEVTVKNSSFSKSAGRGVRISARECDYFFLHDSELLCDNNYFEYCCLRYGTMNALSVLASGAKISHNHFYRIYWGGMDYVGSINTIAEYNVFDEVCYNGDDTSGFANWNSLNRCGNIIRYNLFKNIQGGTNGRFGIYLDGTAGTEIYNNLFYNTQQAVMNNGVWKYNTFTDNIMISPKDSHSGIGFRGKNTEAVEEAIAAGDLSSVLTDDLYLQWKRELSYFDSRPDVKAHLAEIWPGFFDITYDIEKAGEPEFCLTNSVVVTGNVDINLKADIASFDEYLTKNSTIENNIGYTVEENPGFALPTFGDYRVDPESGLPDVRFELIGRY